VSLALLPHGQYYPGIIQTSKFFVVLYLFAHCSFQLFGALSLGGEGLLSLRKLYVTWSPSPIHQSAVQCMLHLSAYQIMYLSIVPFE
jgi:hypothetical protein